MDDLTSSHWDDVVSSNPFAEPTSSVLFGKGAEEESDKEKDESQIRKELLSQLASDELEESSSLPNVSVGEDLFTESKHENDADLSNILGQLNVQENKENKEIKKTASPTRKRAFKSIRPRRNGLQTSQVDDPLQQIPDLKPPSVPVSKVEQVKPQNENNEPTMKKNCQLLSITISDPIKIGDITNAHIEYSISTKTSSSLLAHEESVVNRRFNDFLWLYNQLVENHPGKIIPPAPSKQNFGRFDSEFVELRKTSLEKMLKKIAQDEELVRDVDFLGFLSSVDFHQLQKERGNIHYHHVEDQNQPDDGKVDYSLTNNAQNNNGIMSTFTSAFSLGSNPRYIEEDKWFIETPPLFERFRQQLKSMRKVVEMIISQRQEVIDSYGEMEKVLASLVELEVNAEISKIFVNYQEVQSAMKKISERLSETEMLVVGSTIDEYIRIISSVRIVFENRFKVANNLVFLQHQREKKERSLSKFQGKFTNQYDKIKELETQLQDLDGEIAAEKEKKEKISATIRQEVEHLQRFEKIDDFRSMCEIWWDLLIEFQKEKIEKWEYFSQACNF